jgi:hypothetical protein
MRTFITFCIALLMVASATRVSAQTASSSVDPGTAAWQALQNDEGDTALRLFRTAVAHEPRNAILHMGLGAAAQMVGRDDEAMQSLQTALQFDPTLTLASRLLAEIAFRQGDLALAIATYEAALVHAPANIEMASRLDRLTAIRARRETTAKLTVAVTGQPAEALREHAGRVLNGAYWQVAKLVGAYPASSITVELDASRPFQFPQPVQVSFDDPADGWITVAADGALNNVAAFDRALTFELVQTMVANMAPTGVPAWFAAGLAQVVNTADASQARTRLRAGGEIPWARLETVATGSDSEMQVEDDASFLIVRALLSRIGGRSTELLDELSDGHSLDSALSQFGFSYADLKADVVQSLEQ